MFLKGNKQNIVDVIRDIYNIHSLLLRSELLDTETHRKRRVRSLFEGIVPRENNLVYTELPLPFGSGGPISEKKST